MSKNHKKLAINNANYTASSNHLITTDYT